MHNKLVEEMIHLLTWKTIKKNSEKQIYVKVGTNSYTHNADITLRMVYFKTRVCTYADITLRSLFVWYISKQGYAHMQTLHYVASLYGIFQNKGMHICRHYIT